MKRKLRTKELINCVSENFRQVFYKVSDKELEEAKIDKRMADEDEDVDFTRGGGSNSKKEDGGGDTKGKPASIPIGKRTDRWFDKVEKTADENETRSLQNRKLLERLDYRTVWIARILVGLLIAILGRLIIPAAF